MSAAVYLRDENARTTALARVRCTSEVKELHELLKANPDLLLGNQIDPDLPRKWLLIRHEMPVTDPATGNERWSIDFFYADQLGVPTLVECKRCMDTRSRREVVAQMLEYAANGHHYWSKSQMRDAAQATAGGAEDLQRKLIEIRGGDDISVDEYFQTIEDHLRDSKMRLVFFLEESPNELRSLVEFMNKQLKDTEVLLIEARQYQHGSQRIVVPWLFGYTEEARVAKRESRAQTIRTAQHGGEEEFWKTVDGSDLSDETKQAMRALIAHIEKGPLDLTWGANAIPVLRQVLPTRGLFSLTRRGALEMYFGYWDETKYEDIGAPQIAVRRQFAAMVENVFGVTFSEHQLRHFPKIAADAWVPKVGDFQKELSAFWVQYG